MILAIISLSIADPKLPGAMKAVKAKRDSHANPKIALERGEDSEA